MGTSVILPNSGDPFVGTQSMQDMYYYCVDIQTVGTFYFWFQSSLVLRIIISGSRFVDKHYILSSLIRRIIEISY